MTPDEYHGIIIRESVRDQTIFDKMKILGIKSGKTWTLIKISVEAKSIDNAVQLIRTNLIYENKVPYYAHFYKDDELIAVFPERTFHLSVDKNSWKEAIAYGESLGIPRKELDFRPCTFKDETF